MTEPDIENTLYGLSQQEQCDMDGVWVKVPRQAVDEAITLLRKLEQMEHVVTVKRVGYGGFYDLEWHTPDQQGIDGPLYALKGSGDD